VDYFCKKKKKNVLKNICKVNATIFGICSSCSDNILVSDGDFGKYFHLPVSVNFGKWILFTGKLPVTKKNQLTP
jgi:hypothetical protein